MYACDRVAKLCSLRSDNILKFLPKSDRMRPAYCIALRPEKAQVLLIVRGTKSIGDAVTILTGTAILDITIFSLLIVILLFRSKIV